MISLLLLAAAANVVLLVALLLRSSSNQTFSKDVREDLRLGREELWSAKTIEGTRIRTRAMEKKLRAVEQMDPIDSAAVLSLPAMVEAELDNQDMDEELSGAA